MANVDAASLAQLVLTLGLASSAQLQECREEVGQLGSDPAPLLRVLERKGYITPWQSQKLLKGEQDGYLLGGYRLLYRIAAGSFGRVYRADDPRTGTVVAIKVLRRRYTDNPHQIELFEREGKVGLSLRHPNIVTILAVNRDEPTKQYYIVMEFVEGGNLRDILRIRKKLAPAEALRLLEDVVAGLAYAYTRGLTHRDIKPTNILISAQGTAKLVDFGLAGFYSGHGKAADEQVERTVDYAGLEKATGVKPGDVRSDIYFLGCVFSEMLTGRAPLEPTRDKQLRMERRRFEEMPSLSAHEIGGSEAVARLLETMMALNPQQRFQTPNQLLDAVREARRDLEGKSDGQVVAAVEPSLFVVEKNPALQNALRDKFKELGYRVLMSAEPATALKRFRLQPFEGLVVDAGSVGEDGLLVFQQILAESDRRKHPCAAILLLAQDQADWSDKVPAGARAVTLVRPLTLKTVVQKLRELIPPR